MKNLFLLSLLLFATTLYLQGQQTQNAPYTVKTGDTLYKLASVYGVSVDAIKQQNPSIVGNKLNVGEVISLPLQAGKQLQPGTVYATAPSQPVVYLANDPIAKANATMLPMANKTADEPIARAVSDILTQPKAEIQAVPATTQKTKNAALTTMTTYATVATNANSNTTSPTAKPATATAPATQTAAAASAGTSTYTKLKPVKHKVKEKETLYSIAKLYNQPLATLQNWNNLSDSNIQNGQELIVDWISPLGEALVALELADAKADPVAGSLPAFQKKYLEFEMDTTGMYRLKFQAGAAIRFDDSGEKSSSGNMYCLHRNAPPKSVVKVTNPINKRSVYLMVIEKLPDLPQNDNVLLSMTYSAAQKLNFNSDKLIVESRYYVPK